MYLSGTFLPMKINMLVSGFFCIAICTCVCINVMCSFIFNIVIRKWAFCWWGRCDGLQISYNREERGIVRFPSFRFLVKLEVVMASLYACIMHG